MKRIFKSLTLVLLSLFLLVQFSQAQYVSKKVKSKHQIYTDSLKSIEYDYIFPILGQGAYKQGFDIPYPIGVMGNYIWMDQGLDITNMQLGLDGVNTDIPLTPVDFIEFGENRNTSYSVNFRPDIWVLPFLNVYGLFGYGRSHTEVNLVAPIALKSVVDQKISTKGLGVMTAFGVGPVWLSVDANWTWNKPELLDKPVKVGVMGLRIGQTFTFKQRPDRNIAIWAGAMRVKMSSDTKGAIAMKDALPPDVWDRKDEIVGNYWTWYNGLNPNNPIDKKKIEVADEILTPIIEDIDARNGESIIYYGMDKQATQMWNGIIGGQFQLNKRWMFRTEWGIIGDRKSALVSLNYRFLL